MWSSTTWDPLCRCGNRRCLESKVSVDTLRDAMRDGHGLISVKDFLKLALNGNVGAQRIIGDAAAQVGRLVGDLCNYFNRDVVLVGGELRHRPQSAARFPSPIRHRARPGECPHPWRRSRRPRGALWRLDLHRTEFVERAAFAEDGATGGAVGPQTFQSGLIKHGCRARRFGALSPHRLQRSDRASVALHTARSDDAAVRCSSCLHSASLQLGKQGSRGPRPPRLGKHLADVRPEPAEICSWVIPIGFRSAFGGSCYEQQKALERYYLSRAYTWLRGRAANVITPIFPATS
jgi:hypothetical protein